MFVPDIDDYEEETVCKLIDECWPKFVCLKIYFGRTSLEDCFTIDMSNFSILVKKKHSILMHVFINRYLEVLKKNYLMNLSK